MKKELLDIQYECPPLSEGLIKKKHRPGEVEDTPTIGGTIAKGIIGVSNYMTRWQAYRYLRGVEDNQEDFSDVIVYGTHMEYPLFQLYYTYQDEYIVNAGLPRWQEVYRYEEQIIRYIDGVPFSAHIDGWGIDIDGKKFIIEIKNYSTYAHKAYKKVEESEIVQLMHYQNVLDFDYSILLINCEGRKVFKVERDFKEEQEQKKNIIYFYKKFVLDNVEPAILNVDLSVVKANVNINKDIADLDDKKESHLLQLCSEYISNNADIKKLTTIRETLQANIISIMNNAKLYDGDYIVKLSSDTTTRVDTEELKKAGLFDKYSKESKSIRLNIREKKKC